jgi:uncharacterized membrane protein
MEYVRSITVAGPLDQVAALYVDTALWPEWQSELLSVEVLDGAPPATGGRSRLTYRRGRGTIVMTETVSLSELPGTWNAVYEAPGIHNICDTRFVAVDAHSTRIEQRNVWRLTGMMRLVGVLFRSAFPKETDSSLRIFQNFVEKRLGTTA